MSQSKFLLPVLGAVVVAAGGVGAYFYFTNTANQTATTTAPAAKPAIASVVPKEALLLVAINTDGKALEQLGQLTSPELKKLFAKPLNETSKDLTNQDFNFERDIQPWVGGQVVFAVLPPAKPSAQNLPRYTPVSWQKGNQWQLAQAEILPPRKVPDFFVLVIEVKDRAGATKFVETARAKAGGALKKSNYKGVEITIPEVGGDKALLTAFVNNYLVLSKKEALIQKVIDTANGSPSVADSLLTEGLEVEHPLITFYAPNVSENAEALAQLLAQNSDATPPATFVPQLKTIQNVGAVLGVDRQGVRFRSTTKRNIELISSDPKPSANKLLGLLPAQTMSALTGMDIKDQWAQIVKQAEQSPELKQTVEQMRAAARSAPLNVDLDKEVFGWMDGEYALAVVPSTEGFLAQVGVGPVLMLQTSDRPAAEALLKKLDGIAQQNLVRVSSREVGGVQVTEWADPAGQGVFLAHGWAEPDTLFVTMGPLVSAMVPKPSAPLDADAGFKALITPLAPSGRGYFYLDMTKLWSLVQKQVPPGQISPETNTIFSAIQGISASYVLPDKNTARLDLLLAFKPKGGS
jgi:hypothetical protein